MFSIFKELPRYGVAHYLNDWNDQTDSCTESVPPKHEIPEGEISKQRDGNQNKCEHEIFTAVQKVDHFRPITDWISILVLIKRKYSAAPPFSGRQPRNLYSNTR